MKVAMITPSLENSGPVIVAKNIIDYLVGQGVYCEVFYFTDIVELEFNCKTIRIKPFNFNAINKFDIIHTHGIRPDLYSFLNPNKKIKRISTIHSYIRKGFEMSSGYSKYQSKLAEIVWNIFLVRMNQVIVLTKGAKEYYKAILYNQNIDYIYNGLTFSNNNKEIEDKEIFGKLKKRGYKIIGTSAKLTYIKGLNQVINILPLLKNVVFVIVGSGSEKKELENLAKRLNVSDRCLFLGYKLNAVQYLRYFDCYAMPSYSEGFGLALIEAVASKKAILVSDIGSFREMFNDSEASFFQLDNQESLINSIKLLFNNQEELSKKAYERYLNNYTLECMGKNYLDIYTQILTLK